MNDSADLQRLRELLWRRKLTDSEAAELQKLLAAHPEARADWEAEVAVTRALESLPEAPAVSSNFTSLVMQEIEREAKIRTHTDNRWSLRRWLPRLAFAMVLFAVTFGGWHSYDFHRRTVMAQDVAQLGAALAVSAPELTEDFDSIRRLGDSSPKPDTDLLALVQ